MAVAAKLSAPGRGMVRAPLAPMYDRPNPAAVQTSQRLAGFEVDLLKNEGDWFLARGTDGYEGWMHRAYLSPAPTSGARRSAQIVRISLGCVTRSATGERRSLPLGARLSPDEIVRSGDVVDQPQLPVKFPRTALAITRSAKEFFEGAPYVWGGITPWGADCSGFVQTVYGLHGVALPRDAKLQAEIGDEVVSIDKMEAANLAFFSDNGDGAISHVAIALGASRVAHLALGRAGFHVENLGDRRDPFAKQLAERFVRARRVL
jgi:hypothetical protein